MSWQISSGWGVYYRVDRRGFLAQDWLRITDGHGGGEMTNASRLEQLKKAMASPNEFCVICFGDMGFSKDLHIEHPDRYKNGACYCEGSGQCCGSCAEKLLSSSQDKS